VGARTKFAIACQKFAIPSHVEIGDFFTHSRVDGITLQDAWFWPSQWTKQKHMEIGVERQTIIQSTSLRVMSLYRKFMT
jgi:hypothetical protein